MALKHQAAYFTHERVHEDGGHLYYFAPEHRTAPPYKRQIEVTAILDIASDGTLAGIELVMGDLPPAPPQH